MKRAMTIAAVSALLALSGAAIAQTNTNTGAPGTPPVGANGGRFGHGGNHYVGNGNYTESRSSYGNSNSEGEYNNAD